MNMNLISFMLMKLEVLDVDVNIKKKSGTKIIFDSHEDWPMMESSVQKLVHCLSESMKNKENKLIGKVDAWLTVSDELAQVQQLRLAYLSCGCKILNYWKL